MARACEERRALKILLDFHYSNFWADPGRQDKPTAWVGLNPEELERAVYDHTVETMQALKDVQALPDMVQIGNEINSGMLWPDGKTWGEGSGGFDRLAPLLRAGIDGVRDVAGPKKVEIMLHLAEGRRQRPLPLVVRRDHQTRHHRLRRDRLFLLPLLARHARSAQLQPRRHQRTLRQRCGGGRDGLRLHAR